MATIYTAPRHLPKGATDASKKLWHMVRSRRSPQPPLALGSRSLKRASPSTVTVLGNRYCLFCVSVPSTWLTFAAGSQFFDLVCMPLKSGNTSKYVLLMTQQAEQHQRPQNPDGDTDTKQKNADQTSWRTKEKKQEDIQNSNSSCIYGCQKATIIWQWCFIFLPGPTCLPSLHLCHSTQ